MVTATDTTAIAEHSAEHDVTSPPSPGAVDTIVHTLDAPTAFLDPEVHQSRQNVGKKRQNGADKTTALPIAMSTSAQPRRITPKRRSITVL